jgi:hypothetical protein
MRQAHHDIGTCLETCQQEIQRGLLLSRANEAAWLLAEGFTPRATAINRVMVHGFGVPKWKGGLVFWTCCQDPVMLAQEQDRLITASGKGVAKGALAVLSRLLPHDWIPASLTGVASHYVVCSTAGMPRLRERSQSLFSKVASATIAGLLDHAFRMQGCLQVSNTP